MCRQHTVSRASRCASNDAAYHTVYRTGSQIISNTVICTVNRAIGCAAGHTISQVVSSAAGHAVCAAV